MRAEPGLLQDGERLDELARMEIAVREPISVGELLEVELSFGALADEIVLEGKAATIQADNDGGQNALIVRFGHDQRAKLDYVRSVLDGERPAAARGHRRLPSDLPVWWRTGPLRQQARLGDLSRGGAFVVTPSPPAVGTHLELELHDVWERRVLKLPSVVSWVKLDPRHSGFGVTFRLADRRNAQQLDAVVRHHTDGPAVC